MAVELHYRPDVAIPPGALPQEHLDAQGISARELARRCGRSAKLIVEILAGKAPIELDTALQFGRLLGLGALDTPGARATAPSVPNVDATIEAAEFAADGASPRLRVRGSAKAGPAGLAAIVDRAIGGTR